MRVVPEKNDGKVTFCLTHLPLWAENAEAIGTSEEAVADLQAKTEAARAALAEQRAARDKARAATASAKIAVEAMAVANAAIILQVRSKAESTGDHVYAIASIPMPADPSPIAEPGKPEQFDVKLQQTGMLLLKWKCKNPRGSAGTMYHVYRRLRNTGKPEFLGCTGVKKYTDQSIPAGTTTAMYQIRAVRSTKSGPWAQFNVNLGVTGRLPITTQTAMERAA